MHIIALINFCRKMRGVTLLDAKWGHNKSRCHGKQTCSYCSQQGHSSNNCSSPQPKCYNCKGLHNSTSKNCPQYIMERSICKYKVDQNISYQEARRALSIPTNNTISETETNNHTFHYNNSITKSPILQTHQINKGSLIIIIYPIFTLSITSLH